MFFKFFIKNFKHKKLQYIILVICETAMLLLAIIANAIMNENIAKSEGMEYRAKFFSLRITRTRVSELQDMIYQAAEESPIPFYLYIPILCYNTKPSDPNEPESIPFDTLVWYFPSYSDLKQYWRGTLDDDELPSEQLYNSDEKFAMVGKAGGYDEYGEIEYADENHVILGGEKYLAVENNKLIRTQMFLGHEPTNISSGGLYFTLLYYPTEQQAEDFAQLIKRIFADYINENGRLKKPTPSKLLDIRKASSSIVITAFVQIIAAFNVMLIFKFMIDSRKKQLAVLRLCGFKKSVCLRYSFGELMIVSGVSAIIACVLIQLLKPILIKTISVIGVLYDWGYLSLLALAFLAATALIFLVYIAPSLGKTVSRELREM